MSRDQAKFVFPIAVVLTAVVALLPAEARLPWSRDVSGIARGTLRPFTHTGNTVAGWLRPAGSTADGVRAEQDVLEQLIADRDIAERLYLAERERVRQLEEERDQLQMIDSETLARVSGLLTAYVTARNPGSPLGPVEHLVLELLREVGPASPGELIARSGAAASEVLAAVTFLQVHGLVEREGASSRLKNSVVG